MKQLKSVVLELDQHRDQIVVGLFWMIVTSFLVLSFIAAVKNYSPVPQSDMWYGYLHFFTRISNGEISAWWSQHNEHRILLSRALFWIDIVMFNGQLIFLFVVNYLLAAAIALFFFFYTKDVLRKDDGIAKSIIGSLIVILSFSRIQKENFDWAFQSQFFLAQLLPLISFYLVYKSQQLKKRGIILFFLACITGILSVFAMGNGIATLPLITLLALLVGFRWLTILPAILSVAGVMFYFHGYHQPNGHGSISDAAINHPLDLVQYFFAYLGGPFHHALHSRIFAQISGLIFVGNFLFFGYRICKNSELRSPVNLALMTFISYILITAFATAGGRSLFGIDHALSSGYTTPTMMGWTALLILYAPEISHGFKKYFYRYSFALLLIPALCLPKQLNALDSKVDELFERKISTIALELRIHDEKQLAQTTSSADLGLEMSAFPVEKNISIFNNRMIRDVRQLIGTKEEIKSTGECLGEVEEVTKIEDDKRFVRIKGWMFDDKVKVSPKIIHVLNKDGQIVGYALSGQIRKDAKKKHGKKAEKSGFRGYLLTPFADKNIELRSIKSGCHLKVKLSELQKN